MIYDFRHLQSSIGDLLTWQYPMPKSSQFESYQEQTNARHDKPVHIEVEEEHSAVSAPYPSYKKKHIEERKGVDLPSYSTQEPMNRRNNPPNAPSSAISNVNTNPKQTHPSSHSSSTSIPREKIGPKPYVSKFTSKDIVLPSQKKYADNVTQIKNIENNLLALQMDKKKVSLFKLSFLFFAG